MDGTTHVQVPAQLRQVVDDLVSRCLRGELDRRGLLLAADASTSATAQTAGLGASLLRRLLEHCYHAPGEGARAVDVEFDDTQAAGRVAGALAFGAVTAQVLAPPVAHRRAAGSVDLLCATFNLGVGLVDGLGDRTPQVGLRFLGLLQGLDVSRAARQLLPDGTLRAALPASLASDPTVAFTTRVVEAFFELLHACYPGAGWAPLRAKVGALLEEALHAESQSVDRSVQVTRDELAELVEASRRTSVLPFLVIEHLATGGRALPPGSAGTLLGEAMWRIDDLVDLSEDAGADALNGVMLTAAQLQGRRMPWAGAAGLEKVLSSAAIPRAAAQAAANLDAGLRAALGAEACGAGEASGAGRRLFLSFVQRYAGLATDEQLRLGR